MAKIFYSWQSDLPGRGNRNLIEDALHKAVKEIQSDDSLAVEPVVDRDTLGMPGAPDIAATIFQKIEAATAFVCDVSIVSRSEIGRAFPNPNVLIELGYALKALKAERLILVFNTAYGKVEELPFDLRFKRILTYHMQPDMEPAAARNSLAPILADALRTIFAHIVGSAKDAEDNEFLSALNQVLIEALIVGDESRQRRIDPWSQEVISTFESAASNIRNLTGKKTAYSLNIVDELEVVADSLDEVVHFPRSLGDGEAFAPIIDEAVNRVREMKRKVIDSVGMNSETRAQVPKIIVEQLRHMKQWVSRGLRVDESESYRIRSDFFRNITHGAEILLKVAYHNIDPMFPGLSDALKKDAGPLHLIDLENELSDNNFSKVVAQVQQRIESLEKITSRLI